MSFVKNLWITFRPHFFYVSGAAGLAGMALAWQDPPLWVAITTFLICFFSYGIIQALCDTFDIETDSINAPFRPMVKGDLSVKAVWWTLGSLLGLVAILFLLINPLMLVLQAIALVFSFTYNRMKRIPNAGPLWNGVIVATLPVIGALGVSGQRSLLALPTGVYLEAILVCLVYAGFVLTGYFKDVKGDSQTGYRTAPVRYGIQKAKWHVVPYTFAAVLGALVFILGLFDLQFRSSSDSKTLFIILTSLSVLALILSNVKVIKDPSEPSSYDALLWYTRGMVLYFLSPIALVKTGETILIVILFMGLMEFFLVKTRGTHQA